MLDGKRDFVLALERWFEIPILMKLSAAIVTQYSTFAMTANHVTSMSTVGGGTDDGDSGVVVVPYDRSWPDVYRAVASEIRTLLGDRTHKLFHAGSTSVSGLAAKSIIDVILVVDDSTDEPSYVAPLVSHGYRLVVREAAWFEHRMLQRNAPAVNLHVFSDGCPEIERMLRFRDWLRTHAADRDLYAATKARLAQRSWERVADYADAKTDVVTEIMRRTLEMRSSD